jgi:hypothetical protein
VEQLGRVDSDIGVHSLAHVIHKPLSLVVQRGRPADRVTPTIEVKMGLTTHQAAETMGLATHSC